MRMPRGAWFRSQRLNALLRSRDARADRSWESGRERNQARITTVPAELVAREMSLRRSFESLGFSAYLSRTLLLHSPRGNRSCAASTRSATVCRLASRSFLSHRASGDAPPPRSRSCTHKSRAETWPPQRGDGVTFSATSNSVGNRQNDPHRGRAEASRPR